MAEVRVFDAKLLLDAGRWTAAFYLIGYAVECGLKACVLAHIERTGIIFVDKKFAERCWTHDFEILILSAGLEKIRGIASSANPGLRDNWKVANEWDERSRYGAKSEAEARGLYEAVTDATNGVLPWIRNYW